MSAAEGRRQSALENWERMLDVATLTTYLNHEKNEEERRNAAFQFLFRAGAGEPHNLQPLSELCGRLDVEFSAANTLIREHLTRQAPYESGFLQNIPVWESAQNFMEKPLAVERMRQIVRIFRDQLAGDCLLIAADALFSFATRNATIMGKDEWFDHVIDAARGFAFKSDRMTEAEIEARLVRIRIELSSRQPHFALRLDRKLSSPK